ncbi:MAG: 2-polyprenyl-6-methoxyphenol hydroxylase [Proteobacteria bacterium]|nr:MAG: 2-polyprenyl-6-methoxyphenol hydroxylase [Pseudomonadota bacterium]
METKRVDVLICGAGGSGMTLGIELARRSISFLIIEKSPTPFEGSKGKGLTPRSLEIFDDLGVVDRIYAKGWTDFILRRYSEDGKTFEDLNTHEAITPEPSEPYSTLLLIPQFSTEAILRERLGELGHRVQFASELTSFTDSGDSVHCQVQTPIGMQAIEAKYLVGCDGGKSFVRKSLGINFEGDFLDAPPYLAADVEVEGVTPNVQHRWGTREKHKLFGIGILPHSHLFSIQAALPEQSDKFLDKDVLTQLAQERSGNEKIKITRVAWAATFRFSVRLAEHYRQGRVFICGDAAHVHPPTGGQGLNTSLQDAYNLGWKLASVLNGGPVTLLDSYESERRTIAKGMLELATGIMKKAQLGRGRETHQLDLAYEDSPISFKGSIEKRGVRPGNRAPDAKLRGAGGRTRQVFDLTKGTHFTLLVNGALVEPEKIERAGLRIFQIGKQSELQDEYLEFQKYYGLNDGEAVLIRPDGYIAGVFTNSELTHAETYFTSLGLNSWQ